MGYVSGLDVALKHAFTLKYGNAILFRLMLASLLQTTGPGNDERKHMWHNSIDIMN